MKNPVEVLQMKELELTKVRKKSDALRVALRLMDDETGTSPETHGPPAANRDVVEFSGALRLLLVLCGPNLYRSTPKNPGEAEKRLPTLLRASASPSKTDTIKNLRVCRTFAVVSSS